MGDKRAGARARDEPMFDRHAPWLLSIAYGDAVSRNAFPFSRSMARRAIARPRPQIEEQDHRIWGVDRHPLSEAR
jgi:hypothetical protein